jgi:hypothetical protein
VQRYLKIEKNLSVTAFLLRSGTRRKKRFEGKRFFHVQYRELKTGVHYPGISSIYKEPHVLPADHGCCILNNIDNDHSSLTYFSYVEMVAESIIP